MIELKMLDQIRQENINKQVKMNYRKDTNNEVLR